MNDKEINKGIQDLKNISLSQSEKEEMLAHITSYADFHAPKKALKSTFFSFSFMHSRSSFAISAVVVMLVVTGTTYASESALPGDILYPFKVNVSESVRSAFTLDNEARAKWESEKFIRRVEEAEALASKGLLDEATLAKVESLIDKHYDKFDDYSDRFAAKNASKNIQSDVQISAKAMPVPASLEAQDSTDTARSAGNAAPTMMLFQATEIAPVVDDRDEFEIKIDDHKAILNNLKSAENTSQSERIERLEKKLSEKAAQRAEKRRNAALNSPATTTDPASTSGTPVETTPPILNDAIDDSSNEASVIKSQDDDNDKGKQNGKGRDKR